MTGQGYFRPKKEYKTISNKEKESSLYNVKCTDMTTVGNKTTKEYWNKLESRNIALNTRNC